MDCYKGMTFCYRECANMECERNIKHVPEGVLEPICMAEFMDCEKYKGNEIDNTVKALKDLSNLTDDAIHGL